MSAPPTPPGWVQWPANLPRCAASWSEKTEDPRIHTEMDVGRGKTRRRSTGIKRKIQVTMNAPGSGTPGGTAQDIRTFYEGPSPGGTDGGYHFFKFTSPLDNQEHYYRFAKDGAPQFSPDGPLNWTVAMVWEEYD